ncbi:MAG: hypothetical protein V4659_11140 [Pseudomonadota bacterium]
MSHTQAILSAGAGAAVGVALLAGWRERRRKQRADLDSIGLIAWPTVQMLALIALAAIGLLALRQ